MSDINAPKNKESKSKTYFEEYADAAGLRPTDMPDPHHPLMENNEEVRNLSDLIDVRTEDSEVETAILALSRGRDKEIDVDDALTFPHTKGRSSQPEVSDFDADARDHTPPDDEDDESYMTEADVAESMELTDPDPDAGMDADEFIAGEVDEYRAPDITGTVTGIARGMATHLPQDIGADGFQIEDPEEDADPDLDPQAAAALQARQGHTDPTRVRPEDDTPGRDNLDDGGRIPTPPANPASSDDALDATRRLK